jgi:hypothetical protein
MTVYLDLTRVLHGFLDLGGDVLGDAVRFEITTSSA